MNWQLIFGSIEITCAVILLAFVVACFCMGIGGAPLLVRGIIATPFGLWWGIRTLRQGRGQDVS